MTYEAWRCTYQSAEAAARAAYNTVRQQHTRITALDAALHQIVEAVASLQRDQDLVAAAVLACQAIHQLKASRGEPEKTTIHCWHMTRAALRGLVAEMAEYVRNGEGPEATDGDDDAITLAYCPPGTVVLDEMGSSRNKGSILTLHETDYRDEGFHPIDPNDCELVAFEPVGHAAHDTVQQLRRENDMLRNQTAWLHSELDELREQLAATQPAAQGMDALTHAELLEIKRAIQDWDDCGETDVPYELLMRGANAGYLECNHFTPLRAGALDAAIDAAIASQAAKEEGAA